MSQASIIFYSLVIVCNIIGLSITLLFFAMLWYRRLIVKTDRISYLLITNSYLAFLVTCPFFIEMSINSIYGQLHPESDFRGWECIFKAYISQWTGCVYYYSFLLQAIYRFGRIVYPNRPISHSLRVYGFLSIGQWFLATIVLTVCWWFGYFDYLPKEYHCQFPPWNILVSILGLSSIFLIPFSATLGVYFATLYFVRKRTNALVMLQHDSSVRRDLVILTRLIILFTFVSSVGVPHMITIIAHSITGYSPSWAVSFSWFFTFLSFSTAAVIQMCVSSHMRKLFALSGRIQPASTRTITRTWIPMCLVIVPF